MFKSCLNVCFCFGVPCGNPQTLSLSLSLSLSLFTILSCASLLAFLSSYLLLKFFFASKRPPPQISIGSITATADAFWPNLLKWYEETPKLLLRVLFFFSLPFPCFLSLLMPLHVYLIPILPLSSNPMFRAWESFPFLVIHVSRAVFGFTPWYGQNRHKCF